MPDILSVETVFFTVLGYPMSYIEFFGTLFNVACVWLASRNDPRNWPVGLVGVVLFFLLFREIRLYSDMVEQAYFFFTGLWGWWAWTRPKRAEGTEARKELVVSRGTPRELAIAGAVTLLGSLALGAFMARADLLLPAVFAAPADYPYLDAFTTVLSFVATYLMIRRKVECWYLWILVDVIGVWLYDVKGVRFIALEYVLFLILASGGLYKWRALLAAREAKAV